MRLAPRLEPLIALAAETGSTVEAAEAHLRVRRRIDEFLG
jgi:hypothetical protein